MFNETSFDRHSNVGSSGGGCFVFLLIAIVFGIGLLQMRKLDLVADDHAAVAFADGKAEAVLPGGRYAAGPKWEIIPLKGYLDTFTTTLGEGEVSLVMRYDLPATEDRLEKLLVRIGGPDRLQNAVREAATEAVKALKDDFASDTPAADLDRMIAAQVTKSIDLDGFAVKALPGK